MEKIETTVENILSIRRSKDVPLFAKRISVGMQELLVQAEPGIILSATVSENGDEFRAVAPFVNKPVWQFGKRIVSHNFADSASWASGSSQFVFAPYPGLKYSVHKVVVRFSNTANIIPENAVNFAVYLSVDGKTPVDPAVHPPSMMLKYTSLRNLISESDEVKVTSSQMPTVESAYLIDAVFDYGSHGSTIVMRSSLNEHIRVWIDGDVPVKDSNGNPIDQGWIITFGTMGYDF